MRDARLAPLMLGTMASQALVVVLAPIVVAVADDLDASVGAVGQARAVAAGVALAASVVIARRIDSVAISRLLTLGAGVGLLACAAVAAAPSLTLFLLAQVLVGLALAALLSAGFAGVAAFPPERRAWALGYVAGANALAWIVVNPAVAATADRFSWRAAHAVPAVLALAALIAARWAASPAAAPPDAGLRGLLAERSARRWLVAEVMAFAAWTAVLTFVGAFLIERVGLGQTAAGWALAAGAAAYFASSSQRGRIAPAMPARQLVSATAMVMAVLVVVQFGSDGSGALAVGTFCALGLAAGIRTPASSGLGLDQLPGQPGAMMAARTAATQLGYLIGAIVGGAVLAVSGYGTLGVVLAAGLAASAWLVLRVDAPPLAAPSGETRSAEP